MSRGGWIRTQAPDLHAELLYYVEGGCAGEVLSLAPFHKVLQLDGRGSWVVLITMSLHGPVSRQRIWTPVRGPEARPPEVSYLTRALWGLVPFHS